MGHQNAPVLAQYNPGGIPRTKSSPAATDYTVGQDAQGVYKTPMSAVSGVGGGVGTATAVAGAATVNHPAGEVTSEGLTAATTYTLTLTNSFIKVSSIVLLNAIESTNAAGITLLNKTVTNGQVVAVFSFASLTGTLIIDFAVFN